MKNVIITGGNSGLGFETAKKIAQDKDYKIILACRNLEKGEDAKNKIVEATGNENVAVMKLDTSSLKSVREFADNYIATGEKVYALLNNAGISSMNNDGITEDGFDKVFATNYVGHFLLTQLLLPYMEEDGRIYSTSSDMHQPIRGELEWTDADALFHMEGNQQNYSYSKLCLIYMAHTMAKQFKEEGKKITINAFNPGFMGDTNFMKGNKFSGIMVKKMMPERYGELSTSSDALARLVTEEEFGKISGEYFDRSVNTARSSELSYNDANAEDLYETSLRYTGLK